jgi:hypothetical protein
MASLGSLTEKLLDDSSASHGPIEQLAACRSDANDICPDCGSVDIRARLQCQEFRWVASDAVFHLDHVPKDPSLAKCSLCRFLSRCVQARLAELQVEALESDDLLSTATLKGLRLTFPYNGRTRTLEGEQTYSFIARVEYGPAVIDALPLGEDAFRLANRKESYARSLMPVQADRNLILGWLNECRSRHLSCLKYDSQFCVPNHLPGLRLIDVHASCVVQATAETQEYLALSYVWGALEHLVLKRDNVDHLSKPGAIETSFQTQLPQVIRDAIRVTQDLGFKYLWVDTLCICQDDGDEKRAQIAAMNLIYKGATMTLVAVEADNAFSGLPGVRPYPQPRERIVERVGLIRLTTVSPPIDELLANSKWVRRAWTYGEEQFSRRLLYFTKQQVYFSCLLYSHREDAFDGDPGAYTGKGQRILHDFIMQEYLWLQSCLAEFSPRTYTFPVDRLDAFRSILNELTERGQYPFLEGLPTRDLLRAMCWQHKSMYNRRNLSYPSWSWAGWDGAVSLPERGHLPESGESSVQLIVLPRIASIREHGSQGQPLWETSVISEEAAVQKRSSFPTELLVQEYSAAAVHMVYVKVSPLDFDALVPTDSVTGVKRYSRPGGGGDCLQEPTEKTFAAISWSNNSDVPLMKDAPHGHLRSSGVQSGSASPSNLSVHREPLECQARTRPYPYNVVRLSFTALSIHLPVFFLPSTEYGLVFGRSGHPGRSLDDPKIKFHFDTYAPDSTVLAPSTATNIELLLLSTDISMYCIESRSTFKERGEGKSETLVHHLTARASSAIRALSPRRTVDSPTILESVEGFLGLWIGYRPLIDLMRSKPALVTMMVVEETTELGVYERIGIAEWDEHAFQRCNPQAKDYILA